MWLAASAALLAGVSLARGDFILDIGAGRVVGNDTVYVVSAENDGGGDTGNALKSFDVTVTATNGDLVVDMLPDIDNDAIADADVAGFPDDHNGTATPSFGSALGTFMGLPASFTGKTVVVAQETVGGVYINNQTAPFDLVNPVQAIWHTRSGDTTVPLDANFTNGTVSSLEMMVSANGTGLVERTTPVPFINVVVPTGVMFTITGTMTGNTGVVYTLPSTGGGVSGGNPVLSISVTGSVPSDSNSLGTISMTGSNGRYAPQSTGAISGAARTSGYLTVRGFNPSSDGETYALGIDANGAAASGSTLASIIADLNTALESADGVTASVTGVTPSVAALFPFANVQLNLPSGPNPGTASPVILAYDFSSYVSNGNVTVTDVGVLPEPAAAGVLLLLGLCFRRKRSAIAAV